MHEAIALKQINDFCARQNHRAILSRCQQRMLLYYETDDKDIVKVVNGFYKEMLFFVKKTLKRIIYRFCCLIYIYLLRCKCPLLCFRWHKPHPIVVASYFSVHFRAKRFIRKGNGE